MITGESFTEDPAVAALLADASLSPLLLFPSAQATDITALRPPEREKFRRSLYRTGKEVVIFVLDGTWRTARRMRRLSPNLQALPEICFTPPRPSRFVIRKQPESHCYSTLEAIHYLIELIGDGSGTEHHNLLEVFQFMVAQQLEYEFCSRFPPTIP